MNIFCLEFSEMMEKQNKIDCSKCTVATFEWGMDKIWMHNHKKRRKRIVGKMRLHFAELYFEVEWLLISVINVET